MREYKLSPAFFLNFGKVFWFGLHQLFYWRQVQVFGLAALGLRGGEINRIYPRHASSLFSY